MVLSVLFPVNINIELSPEMVYKYYSSIKFCLKETAEGKQSNLIGKLVEYNNEIQILEKVWIVIIEVALYQEIKHIFPLKAYASYVNPSLSIKSSKLESCTENSVPIFLFFNSSFSSLILILTI